MKKKLRIDKTYSVENKCGGIEEATSASRMEKRVWRKRDRGDARVSGDRHVERRLRGVSIEEVRIDVEMCTSGEDVEVGKGGI